MGRRCERGIGKHLSIRLSCDIIGPQDQANESNPIQAGDEAPGVEATAMNHYRIALPGFTVGCCKADAMAALTQHKPTDRHFGWVKIQFGHG